MTTASQFSSMSAATGAMPWWYWNRFVLQRLREGVERELLGLDLPEETPLLEFGCGNKPYADMATRYGYCYEGADFKDNKHADIVIDEAGRVDCKDGTYPVVLSIQVLEHVPDPGAYLREVRRLLSDGGRLSTHGMWEYHPCPTDYWRWTLDGLEKLLIDNGFKVESKQGIVGLMAASVQLFQDSVRRRLPRGFRQVFVFLCQGIMSLLDRMQGTNSKNRNSMIYLLVASVER